MLFDLYGADPSFHQLLILFNNNSTSLLDSSIFIAYGFDTLLLPRFMKFQASTGDMWDFTSMLHEILLRLLNLPCKVDMWSCWGF